MAQVAAIQSQSYSGRAVGGPVSGNTPYIVGERGPEMFVPPGAGTIVPNSQLQGGGPTNINFTIQAVDARGVDNLLMERKGMIVSMIRSAINDRGQRAPL
jgi:SLT domain-containing protein